MRSLTKLVLAAVMVTSAHAASEGADGSNGPAYLPPPPPIPFVHNWTGFYAGAHAGVGWSNGDSSGSAGFIGGGQVGFNYQINQWVLGVEGDLSGTTIQDSVSATVVGARSLRLPADPSHCRAPASRVRATILTTHYSARPPSQLRMSLATLQRSPLRR